MPETKPAVAVQMRDSHWSAIGRKTFIAATTAVPFLIPVINEFQRQLADRQLDWWTLSSLAVGALGSALVGAFHLQRQATEAAERKAELVTGKDQDDDQLAEGPPR